MCQRYPGPRCAHHAKKAATAALKNLQTEMEDPKATVRSITKAKKEYDEAESLYDSTPTGQKDIKSIIDKLENDLTKEENSKNTEMRSDLRTQKRRLAKAESLRASHITALKELEHDEAMDAALDNKVRIGEESDDFDYRFQKRVGHLLANKGNVIDRGGWGGDYSDYTATEHLRSCGSKYTENIDNTGNIQTYDTFSETTTHGLKASVNCNCGKIKNRTAFYKNDSLPEMIKYLDSYDEPKEEKSKAAEWWETESDD